MIEHVPDLTHLSFTMEYTGDDEQKHYYTRSNTAEFIQMAKQILDFLCDCLSSPRFEEERWQDTREKLRTAFRTDISKDKDQRQTVKHLKSVWTELRICTYDYDGEALKKAFAQGNAVIKALTPAHTNGTGEISLDYKLSATDMKLLGIDMSDGGESVLPDSILSTKASADFYNFNVIADEILIALYGPHPRKL